MHFEKSYTDRSASMYYNKIISLGYNCEVSYRIQDFIQHPIDSYPFSWAYITNPSLFIKALNNLDDILQNEIEPLPWGMFMDKKYEISFHAKGDKSLLFNKDGSLNTVVATSLISELKARQVYLIKKFKQLLNGNDSTLFVIKTFCHISPQKNAAFVIDLLNFLHINYRSQQFTLLVVTDKEDSVFIESLSDFVWNKHLIIHSVKAFATDDNTQYGGDISGWLDVLNRSGNLAVNENIQLKSQIDQLKQQLNELIAAKTWLEDQCHNKDNLLHEQKDWLEKLTAGKNWLEKHSFDQEEYIKELKSTISKLQRG